MNKKVVSVGLILCLFFSSFSIIHAEEVAKPKEITLSLASNMTEKSSIKGVYSDSDFYITIEDLCVLIGGRLEHTDKEKATVSMNNGMRVFELQLDKGKMIESFSQSQVEVSMPSIIGEGKIYISALSFLNYAGVTVEINENTDPQMKVYKRYDLFDALSDYKIKDKGYYFWWDEVDTGKEKIEDKILNAGILSLINRESGFFRMAFDAKGIEREALEDALLTIITNEGQNTLDETDLSGLLDDSNDMLSLSKNGFDFLFKAYDEKSQVLTKDLKLKLDSVAQTADTINEVVQTYENLIRFDTISDTQKDILKNTLLKFSKDSKTLCDGWDVVYDAAKNIDQQIQLKYDKYYKETMKKVQNKGYEALDNLISKPVSFAWDAINVLAKNIPFTKEIISKKDKLYNSYNSSIIQLITNEMLVKVASDWSYGDHKDVKSQEQKLNSIKQLLILQLKSTLTTREYLLDSNFLTSNYAADMKNTNKKLAKFLNQVENCKIVGPGFFSTEDKTDLTWMSTYESNFTTEQALARWEQFITSGEYKTYTDKWENFMDSSFEFKYAIKDLNADGIPECVISAPNSNPFFNTAIFALDKKQVVLADDRYGYGSIRYSPGQNLIVGVSEVRPSADYGILPFYSLQGTTIVEEFHTLREADKSYYVKNDSKSEISDSERQSYYADAEELEWIPIS